MTAYNTLQHNLTDIYSILDTNDELKEIKYFFLNSNIYYNENFSGAVQTLETLIRRSRKILNEFSESASEVEGVINECKNLIMMEQRKNAKLQKIQKKYAKELVQ